MAYMNRILGQFSPSRKVRHPC